MNVQVDIKQKVEVKVGIEEIVSFIKKDCGALDKIILLKAVCQSLNKNDIRDVKDFCDPDGTHLKDLLFNGRGIMNEIEVVLEESV